MEASVTALAAALLVATAPAFAQAGPSFDCAKALVPLERAICGSAGLSKADRELVAAYEVLVGTLSGAARAHLIDDQARWRDDRRACEADGALAEQCLAGRYQDRLDLLQAFGDGSYPFVSEHALAKSVVFKEGGVHNFDAHYPQFDGAGVDFSAVNRGFAEAARDLVEDDISQPSGITRELDFTLYRLNADVVSVQVRTAIYDTTVFISVEGTLVDLRTGKVLRPEDVFAPGEEQHRKFAELVRAAVAQDFKDMGSGVPADLEMLKGLEPVNYLFDKDGLTLSLPVVADRLAMKFYGATIPYAALKPLLRADGPLGHLEK